MSRWQDVATDAEFNDAMNCGYYDLHLSALPLIDESDRMGNGEWFIMEPSGLYIHRLMYEE